jgi:uncharacterized membrane protein
MREGFFSIRKIVMAGVLSAIVMLLGWTRLGFIPVPTAAGNATIMHIPVIIGGILEGWVTGGVIGTIFGLFSFIQATVPMFKDPLVAILPRIFIGITAYLAYRALRRISVPVVLIIAGSLLGLVAAFAYEVALTNVAAALVIAGLGVGTVGAFGYLAFRGQFETVALSVAAAVGTLTNTALVLTMAVVRGYMAPDVAWVVAVTNGIPEVIVAAIITVAVVGAWKRIETGRGEARM